MFFKKKSFLVQIRWTANDQTIFTVKLTEYFRTKLSASMWTEVSGLSRLCFLVFFVSLIVLATILDVVYEYKDKRDAVESGNLVVSRILHCNHWKPRPYLILLKLEYNKEMFLI